MTKTSGLRASVARRVSAFAPGREFRIGLALEAIDQSDTGRPLRVLDAGCEDGRLATEVAQAHPTWAIVGADINDDALQQARARAGDLGLSNVEFLHLDVTQFFADGEYDVVAAVECLAEIPDDRGTLRAFARALRPGGLLIAHVPERSWRPVLRGSPGTWKREARHGYDREELRSLIEESGLVDVRIRPTTGATLHAAEEIRARTRSSRLRVRALAYPILAAALRLERLGLTGGERRALLAVAAKASSD